MPRAVRQTDKLHHLTAAPDQQVRRDLRAANPGEEGVHPSRGNW